MTDNDPKETEESGGDDGGGETPPPGMGKENGYDIREDVDQKLDNLFAGLDEDEEVVAVPADFEDVVDVPEDFEDVVDVPEDDEDTPSQEADAADPPAPPTEAVTPARPPATGGEPKKGDGVSLPPENQKPKAAVKAHPPIKPSPAPEASSQPLSKVSPPPAGPKPRKSLTMRILVWGAVLVIITGTVRYLVTYSSEELATAPAAKTGLLFHKITPVPSPAASITPADQSAPMPPAAGTPQAAPPPKVSAPAAKSTGTVKAYVPRAYPYAIHIASFKSPETAGETLLYYHRGFQAYLVRVDLRKKGVWYRLFIGHFPSATAAVDAIKKYPFTDALVSRTRYACLLGSYPAVAPADAVTRLLAGKGFFSYTLVIGDTYHVFVGAHATRAAAEVLLMDLSAAGFSSNLIER